MADINLGVGGANSATGGYEIENSCKFENDNVEKMTHTYDSAPTSQQKGTMSIWYKRTEIGTNIGLWQFGDDSSGDYLAVRWARDVFGSGESYRSTIEGTGLTIGGVNGAVRDTAAWYHMVVAIDTTQATATNRFRVYRNGEELTWSSDSRASITQNANMAIGENGKDIIIGEGVYRFNGYIAEVNYVDGQQLTSTDFGEYDSDSGIWIPKKYTGTYGNNGFYLDFKNASNLGEDKSGNNHDFTLNNITSANQATDTPTNNFCTWNVNYNYTNSNGNPTITDGATKTAEGSGGWTQAKATMGVTSGKWYWEYKMGGSISFMGVQDDTASQTAFSGQYSLFLYNGDNTVEINDTGSNRDDTTLSYTFSTSNIYAVALNMDDNEISYYQNGSIIGSAISLDGLADRLLLPYIGTNSSTNETNFGGYTTISISSAATDANGYGTFEYAPPSGYYALCTKNLAEFG